MVIYTLLDMTDVVAVIFYIEMPSELTAVVAI